MIAQFFAEHFGTFLSVVLGGLAGWIFERQRKRAELKSIQADSSQKIVDLYQEALDDLKVRYEEKFEFTEVQYNLKTANLIKGFEERHQHLEQKLEKMIKEQEMWKKKYTELKREFENYRTKHQ